MQDVTRATECFGAAMASVNLTSAGTSDFTGAGFPFTCVYKTSTTQVFFADSSSDTAEPDTDYRYICIGVLTTTGTSTTSISTSATTGTSETDASETDTASSTSISTSATSITSLATSETMSSEVASSTFISISTTSATDAGFIPGTSSTAHSSTSATISTTVTVTIGTSRTTIASSTIFSEVTVTKGLMTLVVSDPAAFVSDTKTGVAVAEGIANTVGVKKDQVSVTMSVVRRLALPAVPQRVLTTAVGSVEVSYEITTPRGDDATGTSSSDIVAVLTADSITSVMQEAVSASLQSQGLSYDLTVESLAVLTDTTSEASALTEVSALSSQGDAEASTNLAIVVIISVVCCVGVACGGASLLRWRNRLASRCEADAIPAAADPTSHANDPLDVADDQLQTDHPSDAAPIPADMVQDDSNDNNVDPTDGHHPSDHATDEAPISIDLAVDVHH